MVNSIVICIVTVFSINSILASTAQERFLQANQNYYNKSYEKSYQLYKSIKNKGPATWQNMGNCLFKMNKPFKAFLCWKKAKKNASYAEALALENNIAIVNQTLGKKEEKTLINSFFKLFDFYVYQFSLFFLQLLFLSGWFCFFIIKKIRWRYKKLLQMLVFLGTILVGAMLLAKYRLESYPQAFVLAKETKIFNAPDKRYPVVSILKHSDEVKILAKRNIWCKVRHNNLLGWTLLDQLEII